MTHFLKYRDNEFLDLAFSQEITENVYRFILLGILINNVPLKYNIYNRISLGLFKHGLHVKTRG